MEVQGISRAESKRFFGCKKVTYCGEKIMIRKNTSKKHKLTCSLNESVVTSSSPVVSILVANKVGWRRMVILAGFVCAGVLIAQSEPAQADDTESLRRAGLSEVREAFMRRGFAVDATLVERTGPEFLSGLVGKPLEGCPAAPVADFSDTFSIKFQVGDAQSWAGKNDGVNTRIKTDTGLIGTGFALPSNSSALLPENQSGPQFNFMFDGTNNVQRALIDQAIQRLDACLEALPPGSYPGDELARLCPYPEIPREQAGQTCVVSIFGMLTEATSDGGFKVTVNRSTMCDFVGFNGTASTSTSFKNCFNERYEGTARMLTTGSLKSFVRAAAATAQNRCKRSGKAGVVAGRRINRCVARSMTQAMQRGSR